MDNFFHKMTPTSQIIRKFGTGSRYEEKFQKTEGTGST